MTDQQHGTVITILVADDHEVVRDCLRTFLEVQPGWRTLEASNGEEAVLKASQLHPQLVILDIEMPKLNGLDAASLIHNNNPDMPILLLSAHFSDHSLQRALEAGVRGYILKSDSSSDLVCAVRTLLQGREFFGATISRRLTTHVPVIRHVRHLTLREAQIVQLLGEGKSNKQVADALGISPRTVEGHRTNIMRKFGFQSFSELLRYAIRESIVQP